MVKYISQNRLLWTMPKDFKLSKSLKGKVCKAKLTKNQNLYRFEIDGYRKILYVYYKAKDLVSAKKSLRNDYMDS